jgi:hypothetical protein
VEAEGERNRAEYNFKTKPSFKRSATVMSLV